VDNAGQPQSVDRPVRGADEDSITDMWLLWISVALLALRYFEIGPFAAVSWWWVAGAFGAAFVWFEFVEKSLGLEKKKAMDEMEAARKARIKRALEKDSSKPR